MAEFEINDAGPKPKNIKLGLAGPTGSGKTYSALVLASNMYDWKEIGVIDTEQGRSLHYAYDGPGTPPKHKFRFRHMDLTEPFSAVRYLAAMQAMEDAGVKIIIVDSLSHLQEPVRCPAPE